MHGTITSRMKNLAQRMLGFFVGEQPAPVAAPAVVYGSARAKRRAEKRADGLGLGVVHGRLGFVERRELVGGKGLRS